MADDFEIEKIEWFDDVVFDDLGNIVSTAPFTLNLTNGVFDKYVVYYLRGPEGSYPNAMKLEPPESYGGMMLIPGGVSNVKGGVSNMLANRVSLLNPTPGMYVFTVYMGDATVGRFVLEM